MKINAKLRAAGIKYVRGPFLGITEFSMRNGLRVLVKPDDTIAAAIVMTAYRVGSRNEGAGEEGGAHLFEHLAFKGSRRFNPAKGNNLDDIYKEIGGIVNAYTSDDQTVYHVKVPAEHIEVALAIDADRMRFLHIRDSDKQTEMPVVRQEMDQGENRPDQVLRKLLMQTAFREHPYHHDTIGSASAVENVSIPTLKEFYDKFYHPNNATVIVMGNVDIENVLSLVQKHYGRLPRSPKPIPQVYVQEPVQEGERRFEIIRTGDMARVTVGYHIPQAAHADTPALHVLAHILGSTNNRSSRLYASLMQTGMVAGAYAHAPESHDPHLLTFGATVNEGVSAGDVEAVFHAEVDRLIAEPVSAEELARVKNVNHKGTSLAIVDTLSFADMIADAEGFGDWMQIVNYDALYAAVTVEDIQRVASKYLRKSNRTVGYFTPRGPEHDAAFPTESDEATSAAPVATPSAKPKKERAPRAVKAQDPDIVGKTLNRFRGKAVSSKAIAERIVTTVLPNGLTVNVLQEKVGSGVVCISTNIKAGTYLDPEKAVMITEMLGRGSANFSKEAIAAEMSEFGVSSGLRFGARDYFAFTSNKVTTADISRYLTVVADVLRNPVFSQEELDQTKLEFGGQFKLAENQPAQVAMNALSGAIYAPGHSFYRMPIADKNAKVQALTVGDLADFHRTHYVPGAASITVVGDIEVAAALELVTQKFGSWEGESAKPISVAPAAAQTAHTVLKKMNDKPAVSIILGAPIELTRSSPDYPAARLGMQILGGDTLTAKLGKRVREELGLTYGIYARMGEVAFGSAPFMVTMSVATRNIDVALAETHAILDRFVEEGVTERELATQVNGEAGQYQLGLASLQSITIKIGEYTAHGLDLAGIDDYAATLKTVTVEEVNAAIKKYFDPAKLVTVIAGTI